jgi:hypothetical protein
VTVPLLATPLSRSARAIADFLAAGLDANNRAIRVQLGHPAAAAPEVDALHRLNLFFYRVEPFEFDADAGPQDVGRLRLHCLITAFGVVEDQVSAGENELRMLGEVLRLFQQTPIQPELDLDGESVRLQAIPQPLTLDDINRLWATQGDAEYRLSLGYELSLVPVVPATPRVETARVGAIGAEARGSLTRAAFGGRVRPPEVGRTTVPVELEDWAPQIAFVLGDDCAASLAFELGSPELAAFTPRVWLAGEAGAVLELVWERWTRAAGWQVLPGATAAAASGPLLDPAGAAAAPIVALALPDSPPQAGQLLLYARRSYTRAADGVTLALRSNPLLITLVAP